MPHAVSLGQKIIISHTVSNRILCLLNLSYLLVGLNTSQARIQFWVENVKA